MPARLVIAPEAELDITEAYISPELAAQRDASGPGSSGFQYGRRHVLCRWYESRRAGLGEEFLSSVDACIERIRREPMIYSIVHEAYRRALIRRFPYAIFFESEEARITVYAVFHTSRDPKKWRQRFP